MNNIKTVASSAGPELREQMLRLCHDLAIVPLSPKEVVDQVLLKVADYRLKAIGDNQKLLDICRTVLNVKTALTAFDSSLTQLAELLLPGVTTGDAK